jgi:uncharacterized protein (DUF2336 family)
VTPNFLQKSPEAESLLVQLHDKHTLYGLAGSHEPSARAELADIMADLLTMGVSPSESELITDVLMSLVRQAEQDLKQAVAERLSTMDEAPVRLMINFANDDIAVADPVLRNSKVLEDMDLIYIVHSQDTEHWQAIAQRSNMSEQLIDVLADTKDEMTAVNLANNKVITLTTHALNSFTEMALSSDLLKQPLLTRDELPKEMANKLYEFAACEMKAQIREDAAPDNREIFDNVLDEVMCELSADQKDMQPSEKMIQAAKIMHQKQLLDTKTMINNLRLGQYAYFISQFATYCNLPLNTVKEMVKQETAQGMAVTCKAMNILKSDFINIFLMTSRLRGGKIVSETDLKKAISYYDKIEQSKASEILNSSVH